MWIECTVINSGWWYDWNNYSNCQKDTLNGFNGEQYWRTMLWLMVSHGAYESIMVGDTAKNVELSLIMRVNKRPNDVDTS